MNRLTKLFASILALSAMVFVVGCSDDDDNGLNPTMATSKVRVIHTSYDAPAVDVVVDGSVAINSLDYGISSGYATVDAGTRNIKVTPANASNPVVIEADLPLEADKNYSVFAVNSLNSIEAVVVEDNRTPNANKAKVRFLHASPDAPAVDIKVGSGSGPAVFSNVAFKQIQGYAEVDQASYTFVVTAAGSTGEVVKFDPITVQNGNVYTVVAHGTLNANDAYPFAVRVFVDNDPGNAFVDLTIAK